MGIKRSISEWCLPPKFKQIITRGYDLYSSKIEKSEGKILSRNKIFENKYKGKRCFVIGNGPSLNQLDLTHLEDEITIVMNHFSHHPILKTWQPTLYCAADPPQSYMDDPGEIERISDTSKKIFPEGYFLPLSMKKMVEDNDMFPTERTFYIKTGSILDDWREKIQDWNIEGLIPGVQNTVQLGVILGMYLGCSPIILIGVDHDFLIHRSGAPHFYNEDPELIGGISDSRANKYLHDIEIMSIVFKGYEVIHMYADKHGIQILNATPGSYLDEFPFIEYQKIFD